MRYLAYRTAVEQSRAAPEMTLDAQQIVVDMHPQPETCAMTRSESENSVEDLEAAGRGNEFNISDFIVDPEADRNGNINIFRLKGDDVEDDLIDEFDKYAGLPESKAVDPVPAQEAKLKKGKETEDVRTAETEQAPPLQFTTTGIQQQLKNYKNPYEGRKRNRNSGRLRNGQHGDLDDTYLWIQEVGGTFRDDDFTKYPVLATNPIGYTLYWEPGDRALWEKHWPQLARDLQMIRQKNAKLMAEVQHKEYNSKF